MNKTLLVMLLILGVSILSILVGSFITLGNIDRITKHDCDRFGRLYLENVEYACVRVPE